VPYRPDRLLRVDELMAKSAENTAKIQRGKPFEPGKSGNPAGKPKGSRNQITLAIEALLDGEGEALTQKAIELAKAGDMQALRLCLDRLVPPRKDRPVSFELPAITCAGDAAKASAALVAAVSIGQITPSEAVELGRLLESYVKTLEATDLEERLKKLEKVISQ
jgi:Family of unknown function (DUF5681)